MASSSGTGGSDEEEHHNTWDMLVERGIYDLDAMQGGIVMPPRVGRIYVYIYIYIEAWSDKQGSDCDTPKT